MVLVLSHTHFSWLYCQELCLYLILKFSDFKLPSAMYGNSVWSTYLPVSVWLQTCVFVEVRGHLMSFLRLWTFFLSFFLSHFSSPTLLFPSFFLFWDRFSDRTRPCQIAQADWLGSPGALCFQLPNTEIARVFPQGLLFLCGLCELNSGLEPEKQALYQLSFFPSQPFFSPVLNFNLY